MQLKRGFLCTMSKPVKLKAQWQLCNLAIRESWAADNTEPLPLWSNAKPLLALVS